MKYYNTQDGKKLLLNLVSTIQQNKGYLGEIDGLIGDGDHGMNMNKGFTMFKNRYEDQDFTLSKGLENLSSILMNEIGGSMGPIYGTVFYALSEECENVDALGLNEISGMFSYALGELKDIVEANIGDKTLVDALEPACISLANDVKENTPLSVALENMKKAATEGRDSTLDMVAKFGRSSRLGERSRGVLDAGACSCCLLICAFADTILENIEGEE